MASLYQNNSELLAALAILAPEGNVRVALVGLIDVLEGCSEDIMWDRRGIFEIIARGIIRLNFNPDDDDDEEGDVTRDNADGLSPEEIIEKFRAELGIDEEEK